jgi:hypothetical protein
MTSSYTRVTDLQDAIDALEDQGRSAMTRTIETISKKNEIIECEMTTVIESWDVWTNRGPRASKRKFRRRHCFGQNFKSGTLSSDSVFRPRNQKNEFIVILWTNFLLNDMLHGWLAINHVDIMFSVFSCSNGGGQENVTYHHERKKFAIPVKESAESHFLAPAHR